MISKKNNSESLSKFILKGHFSGNSEELAKNIEESNQQHPEIYQSKPKVLNRGSSGSAGSNSEVRMTRSFSTSRISSAVSRLGTAGSRAPTPGGKQDLEQSPVLQKKLKVYRNQVLSLNKELDRLKEVLGREVGASELESILSGEEKGWVGRAEQILVLQQTVDYLQGLIETRQTNGITEEYLLESESVERARTRANSDSISEKSKPNSKPGSGKKLGEVKRASVGLTNSFKILEENVKDGDVEYLARKCSDLDILRKAGEVEKKRLGELVRLLTSRLSILEQRTRLDIYLTQY